MDVNRTLKIFIFEMVWTTNLITYHLLILNNLTMIILFLPILKILCPQKLIALLLVYMYVLFAKVYCF